MKAFNQVFRIYNHGGFTISKIHCDPEFHHLHDVLVDIDIELNCALAQQHVVEVERSIQVIKEQFRLVYHHLPFQSMPKVLICLGVMEST